MKPWFCYYCSFVSSCTEIFIYNTLRNLEIMCKKMSSISCVTETCARDPTPQSKRVVADYSIECK